jgi:hypothetical protein
VSTEKLRATIKVRAACQMVAQARGMPSCARQRTGLGCVVCKLQGCRWKHKGPPPTSSQRCTRNDAPLKLNRHLSSHWTSTAS